MQSLSTRPTRASKLSQWTQSGILAPPPPWEHVHWKKGLVGSKSVDVVWQGRLGELLISLNYQPNVGVISVGVIKARNLKAKDINGLSGKLSSSLFVRKQ